jgi:hypothetical protein
MKEGEKRRMFSGVCDNALKAKIVEMRKASKFI